MTIKTLKDKNRLAKDSSCYLGQLTTVFIIVWRSRLLYEEVIWGHQHTALVHIAAIRAAQSDCSLQVAFIIHTLALDTCNEVDQW